MDDISDKSFDEPQPMIIESLMDQLSIDEPSSNLFIQPQLSFNQADTLTISKNPLINTSIYQPIPFHKPQESASHQAHSVPVQVLVLASWLTFQFHLKNQIPLLKNQPFVQTNSSSSLLIIIGPSSDKQPRWIKLGSPDQSLSVGQHLQLISSQLRVGKFLEEEEQNHPGPFARNSTVNKDWVLAIDLGFGVQGNSLKLSFKPSYLILRQEQRTISLDACLDPYKLRNIKALEKNSFKWFFAHLKSLIIDLNLSSISLNQSLSTLRFIRPTERDMILRLSNSRAYGSDGRSQQKILSDPQLSKLFPSKSLSDLILKSCDLYGDLQAIEWHDRSARSDCLREFNLSFRQLSISARNLSTLLKESLRRSDLLATGRKQQHVIGLYMDKNPWLVVILLAVSLTGSAYLNLDVATPTKRNNELVQKAQVSLILTFDASNYPALDFHNFLDLKNLYQNCSSSNSDYLKELSIKSFEVEEDYLCSEDLAYLVSTSGSTGSPKLIPISHSNVLSFLFNYFRRFQRKIPTEAFKNDGSTHTNQTRVFQFPSYAFDVSVMNIWDPLLHGSTICMTSSDNLRSDLMGSIIDLRCDSIDLTPSVASLLLDHPLFTSTSNSTISQVKKLWKSSGLFLNHLNTGSEHLPPSLKQAFITRGVSVCLDYGPSETTVGVISSLNRAIFERDDDHDDDIGKPTGENEIYILEPDGEDLVPLGGIGEICVSGAQVSKGYCDQRLSEGKFIDLDLDCGYKGSRKLRIYRTGDLAQFLPWGSEGFGSIRFLGRKDRQIKISGIRIELDEVENRLNEIISLDSCKKYLIKIIVDHWKTSGDQGSVVSFIQIGQASGLNIGNNTCAADKSDRLEFINSYDQDWFNGLVDEIKRLASLNLPSTMIPKHWILINLIPMNISGKVDRKALKELLIKYFDEKKQNKINLLKKKTLFQTRRERAFYDDEKDLIEVERIEEAVSKAWSECLHGSVDDYNKFEANDDFIRIGGDSIGMMRVIERIRRRGFDRVKFSDLVSCSTFKDFVKVLLKHNRNDSETNGRNQGYDVQQNISEIKTGGIRRTEPYRPFELIESEGDELRKKILDYLRDSYQIEEKEVEDIYPSSSSQDGIITSSQNDPRGMYYAQAIYDLNRDFNSEDLAFGLIELVKRHSNLRTIFIFSGKDLAKFKNGLYSKNKSGILQIVLKNFSSKVNKTCDIVKVERLFDYNSEIEEYLKEDRIKNQFSWGKVCVSMKIFECEESEERKLVWSIHHSLSDGWTLELLMKELKQIIQPSTSKSPLSKIYSSSTGNCSKLNDLQRPSYGEFVKAWSNSVDDQNEEILRFWKDYLIDFRSNNKTHKGIKVDHVTQKNLFRTIYRRGELERISRSIGITSAIFFRVAVGIGLYNSGLESSPDVVFGTVRSGRDIELSDGSWAGEISGCCVSVLPTRIRLEGPRMKIVDLLRKEKSEDSDIRKNQLIRLSELNRKFLGDENILDILLTFQSWDLLGEEKKRSDQPIRQPPTRIEMPTRYKLSIEITAEDELKQGKKDFGIEFRVFYDQEVYEDVDIVKFLKEMESVCENLIGCVEKDERLEKIINFKPKRKRVDDEYQLKRYRVEEDREVCLLEGKSINEKVNGYYSDMNENDICCKLSSYKNQQPGIKHYESKIKNKFYKDKKEFPFLLKGKAEREISILEEDDEFKGMKEIWSRVLGFERIESCHLDLSFQDLGGDSIGLMRLIYLIKERYEIKRLEDILKVQNQIKNGFSLNQLFK